MLKPKTGQGADEFRIALGNIKHISNQLNRWQVNSVLDFSDSDNKLVHLYKFKSYRGVAVLTAFFILSPVSVVSVQAIGKTVTSSTESDQDQVVDFPASFFSLFKPTTALDMVRQMPGFQLDDAL